MFKSAFISAPDWLGAAEGLADTLGKTPGTKVHETGIPWNDPSGDRPREWMAIDRETFYDASRIAIMPMGFCYPGRFERGGDEPPRPECAPAWHDQSMVHLPNLELTLLVGVYAKDYYRGGNKEKTLTATVARWWEYLPDRLPTPHPSWRTTAWQNNTPGSRRSCSRCCGSGSGGWFRVKILVIHRPVFYHRHARTGR